MTPKRPTKFLFCKNRILDKLAITFQVVQIQKKAFSFRELRPEPLTRGPASEPRWGALLRLPL